MNEKSREGENSPARTYANCAIAFPGPAASQYSYSLYRLGSPGTPGTAMILAT